MDTEDKKLGAVLLVLAVIAVAVGLFLWSRRAGASSDPTKPITPPKPVNPPVDPTKPTPPVVPVPDPIVVTPIDPAPLPVVPIIAGNDPHSPTSTPQCGKYYAVKSGDSDALICKKAFNKSHVYAERSAMRDHEQNSWIGKTSGGGQLNLVQGFAAMPGYESATYAWKTEKLGSGGHKWPVVYVPTPQEIIQ